LKVNKGEKGEKRGKGENRKMEKGWKDRERGQRQEKRGRGGQRIKDWYMELK
jgi:hypothetical protein